MKRKKLSKSENQDWLELCKYVKSEILRYDDSMRFPKFLALRLKGLSKGQFIANKNQKQEANYSFKTILMAFQILKIKISTLIYDKEFKDEFSKINYIMAIVENEINDILLNLRKKEKFQNTGLGIDLTLFKPLKTDIRENKEVPKTKGERAFDELTKWMW